MMKPIRLAVLGSTGSIGQQTLDVARRHPDKISIIALTAGENVNLLQKQAAEFKPRFISCRGHNLVCGNSLCLPIEEMARHLDVDIVLVAVPGGAGLSPALAAAGAGKTIALANKECLVAAGEILLAEAKSHGAQIRPVDSEHSAIWQCLTGETSKPEKLILTASGGPFRDYPIEKIESVTPEQALAHPSWKMGKKVTIDSATLMNKGLEVIEAHRLYGIPYERIEVVIHPQSIIHSMAEFADGAVKAQLSPPDMRLPIQYALSYPDRWETPDLPRADWPKISRLDFSAPDFERFPCLKLAIGAGKKGATFPAVLSAADEEAVELFLSRKIKFGDIARLVGKTLEEHIPAGGPSLENIADAENWARQRVSELARSL
ncbi:1-deoxy-D-xylulose-5-phosphate reductoisomerase [Dehalogenimonas etheniformans]|uniref:1-deoxy-D-xylulose 5-phosphate reductoisomerase n=1 Tax=Dehalogenimonas etheniformans TaxID=1536648 RepID=A0A2P5P7D6_9CHLR|nr:1-deoxy-D-xylulose-5-phosphate reductoisomerase [Dehalogenimonas etheniformans]PPD58211.1 1-deoxy-D-xylulose-5-phosphate reductoisomerase [Dehalogenimonas etheniformans]QNT75620.1 1-deoxy-D-xylulose-5-phosphate reductoisomerase [Dehalogenimonas etheniformans]